MPSQNDIRQSITDQIIAALESGEVPPWRRPWRLGKNAGTPANVVTKRAYRGLNPLLLALHAEKYQLNSKWYGTWNQWRQMGGQVKKRPAHVPEGQWGCQIVFWSPVTKTVQTAQGDEEDRFFVLRLYTVFNVDQVEGLNHLRADQVDPGEPLTVDYKPADEALEAALCGMGVSLRYGGGRALYDPHKDTIQMPPKATFVSLDEYFATAFHECVHATEHPDRLDWSRKNKDNSYALGELIAELGGVFVCRELDVPASDDLSNHTAYLASWLRGMKGDSRFVFMASAQASKAASYLLSFSRKPEDVPEEQGELATA